jgi:hypothetical protein
MISPSELVQFCCRLHVTKKPRGLSGGAIKIGNQPFVLPSSGDEKGESLTDTLY